MEYGLPCIDCRMGSIGVVIVVVVVEPVVSTVELVGYFVGQPFAVTVVVDFDLVAVGVVDAGLTVVGVVDAGLTVDDSVIVVVVGLAEVEPMPVGD